MGHLIYKDNKYLDIDSGEVFIPKDRDEEFLLNFRVRLEPETKLWFGKHKDKTMAETLHEDRSYIYWLHDKGFNLSKDLKKMSNDITREHYRMLKNDGEELENIDVPEEMTHDEKTYASLTYIGGGKIMHVPDFAFNKWAKQFKSHLDETVLCKHHPGGDRDDDEWGLMPGDADSINDCFDFNF